MIFLYKLIVKDYDISHIELNTNYLLTDVNDSITTIVQYVAKYLSIRQNINIKTKYITFGVHEICLNINSIDIKGNLSMPLINTIIPIRKTIEDTLSITNNEQKILMKTVNNYGVSFGPNVTISLTHKYSGNKYLSVQIHNNKQDAIPYVVKGSSNSIPVNIEVVKRNDISIIDEIFPNTIFDTVYCYQKEKKRCIDSVYIEKINNDVSSFQMLVSPSDFKILKAEPLSDTFYSDITNLFTKNDLFIVRKSDISYIEKIIIDIVKSCCIYEPIQNSIYVTNKHRNRTPDFIVSLEKRQQTKIAIAQNDVIICTLDKGEILHFSSYSNTKLQVNNSCNNLYLHVTNSFYNDSNLMIDKFNSDVEFVPLNIVDVVNNVDTTNIYEIDTKKIINNVDNIDDIASLIKSEFISETEQDFDEIMSKNKMIILKNHTVYDIIYNESQNYFSDIYIKNRAICKQICIDILQMYTEHQCKENITEITDIVPLIKNIFIEELIPFIESQYEIKSLNVNDVYITSYNSITKRIYNKAKRNNLRVLVSLSNTDVIFNNKEICLPQGCILVHAFEKDVILKTKSTTEMYMLIYDIYIGL